MRARQGPMSAICSAGNPWGGGRAVPPTGAAAAHPARCPGPRVPAAVHEPARPGRRVLRPISHIVDLVARIDAALRPDSDIRDDPTYRQIRAHRRIDHLNVVTSSLPIDESATADFSRASIETRIRAGYDDAGPRESATRGRRGCGSARRRPGRMRPRAAEKRRRRRSRGRGASRDLVAGAQLGPAVVGPCQAPQTELRCTVGRSVVVVVSDHPTRDRLAARADAVT